MPDPCQCNARMRHRRTAFCSIFCKISARLAVSVFALTQNCHRSFFAYSSCRCCTCRSRSPVRTHGEKLGGIGGIFRIRMPVDHHDIGGSFVNPANTAPSAWFRSTLMLMRESMELTACAISSSFMETIVGCHHGHRETFFVTRILHQLLGFGQVESRGLRSVHDGHSSLC